MHVYAYTRIYVYTHTPKGQKLSELTWFLTVYSKMFKIGSFVKVFLLWLCTHGLSDH